MSLIEMQFIREQEHPTKKKRRRTRKGKGKGT